MIHDSMGLVRVTEAAALAACQWIGTGDKLSADKAATDAMRERLNHIHFSARIKIGEGKKDHASGLFQGEVVGKLSQDSKAPVYELAVDPIDGTRPTVTSGPEAMSVLAVSEDQSLFTTELFYMHKIAYGPAIREKIELSLKDSIPRTVEKITAVTGKSASRIVVCLLDRPRHQKMIEELRSLGVRIKLIQDCDISGAIATCQPESGIDLLYGIGGAPEAVITACAMKCLKGGFQAQAADGEGKFLDSKIHFIDELVKGECAFVATGITNGSLLRGVRFTSRGPVTHSLVMRSESHTVRWITAYHGN